jgi:anti-anti-sigma factor
MSFTARLSRHGTTALITVDGELDALTVNRFRDQVERVTEQQTDHLLLDLTRMMYLSSAGLRGLVYLRQRLPGGVRVVLVGANDAVQRTIRMVGFHYGVEFSDELPPEVSAA